LRFAGLNPRESSMMQSLPSVLVCGTIRDGARHLDTRVKTLSLVLESYFKVDFYVVESDSQDSTVDKLVGLSQRLDNFSFLSLGELAGDFPDRLERLAFCRNKYMEYFEAHAAFDYLIVADVDGINDQVTKRSFKSLWEFDDWGGCFANQNGPYYEVGALRLKGWIDADCHQTAKKLEQRGLAHSLDNEIAVTSRMIRIPTNTPSIEVESAHGVLGIYKREFCEGSRYASSPHAPFVEIVAFNAQVRRNGGKLFILPSMVNATFTGHTIEQALSYRFLRRITKLLRIIGKRTLTTSALERLVRAEKRVLLEKNLAMDFTVSQTQLLWVAISFRTYSSNESRRTGFILYLRLTIKTFLRLERILGKHNRMEIVYSTFVPTPPSI